MTTTPIAGDREPVRVAEPLFSDSERAALAGFLAGYSGLTRYAYTLDLRQYMSWCGQHGLHLFGARRADIESFGRDMEAAGRAPARAIIAISNPRTSWAFGPIVAMLPASGWPQRPTSELCSSGQRRASGCPELVLRGLQRDLPSSPTLQPPHKS
jgi:hypothetical protein